MLVNFFNHSNNSFCEDLTLKFILFCLHIFHNCCFIYAKHISKGDRSGEYIGRKFTLKSVCFKVLIVFLILCDDQLSIINSILSYSDFLLEYIQLFSFLIKWQKVNYSIVFFDDSRNHFPFDKTARIYMLRAIEINTNEIY